jgi:hypothetical protein
MSTPPRDCFTLVFPADVPSKDAGRCFDALTGICGVVLEVEASPAGFMHRVHVEHRHAAFVAAQLRVLLPGIRVTPITPPAEADWTRVVEVGMRRLRRTVRAGDPERLSSTLLASMQHHRTTVLLQWVLSPALPERLPARRPVRASTRHGVLVQLPDVATSTDAVADVREKLSMPNYLAVLRIAVKATSPTEARAALSSLRIALTSAHNAANSFYARLVPQAVLRRRINKASVPWSFPVRLSTNELVALCGWPVGAPTISGLSQARTRQLPAPAAIPSRGLVLCDSNFPGDTRPLAVSTKNACMHIHACGPTGTGKTAVLANLASQIMQQGYGLVVIEAKGQLCTEVIARIPKKRLDDVVIFDVADEAFPVGYNILSDGEPRATVESICALFEHLYRDSHSVWTRELLFHGLSTLVTDPLYAFTDLAPLLVPLRSAEEAWRTELIAGLHDPELKDFWARYLAQSRAQQERMAQPVLDRVWQLSARPNIRNIIGQSRSSFRIADIAADSRILIVNLAGLGSATASLTGTILVSSLWRAVQSTPHKRPLLLLLDEFQDFANLPEDPKDMLVKCRSAGLGVVAAHQDLAQLQPELRAATLANMRTKLVFQITADDARTFAHEFGRTVTDADFLNLGRFEVLAKIMTDSGVSAPVTGITRPLSRRTTWANEARTRSQERYGRPVPAVEAEIASRRTARRTNQQLPRLGGQEWS